MSRSKLEFQRSSGSCCSFNRSSWLLLLPRSSINPTKWLLHRLIINAIDYAKPVADIYSLLMHGSNLLVRIKHFLVSSSMNRQLAYYIFPIDNIPIPVYSCSHIINRKSVLNIRSVFDSFVYMLERKIWQVWSWGPAKICRPCQDKPGSLSKSAMHFCCL